MQSYTIKSNKGPPEIPRIPVGPVSMSHVTEKLLVCPYNPAHAILAHRMQTHLHRCRKQHEGLDWGSCSHNNTHRMPLVELEHHEQHLCVNRHSFQSMCYNFGSEEQKSLAPIVHVDLPEPEENWDDGQVFHFDPKKNASEKSIIRGIHCESRSKRIAFKQDHRIQLQERLKREAEEASGSKANMKSRAPEPEQVDFSEPLRPPKELPKGFVFARGSKTRPDNVLQSPGMSTDLAKLSLKSVQEADSVTPQVSSVQWSGLGRGRSAAEPGTIPPNAWGRGKPKV